jgi:hypothetical protein
MRDLMKRSTVNFEYVMEFDLLRDSSMRSRAASSVDDGINVTVTPVNPSYAFDCVDSASYPSDAAVMGMGTVAESEDTYLYECGMLIVSTPPAGGGSRRLMIIE